jgi:hypothetical protein
MTVGGVDSRYFYKSYDDLDNIYTNIINFIQSPPIIPMKITEKLASQTNFVSFVSAKDKGGRSYSPDVSDGLSGEKTYYFNNGISKTYTCNADETSCIAGADETMVNGKTVWTINNNFIEVVMRVKFASVGSFDIDSNANGCQVGKINDYSIKPSKVEYYDSQGYAVIKTLYLPSKCIEVVYSGGSLLNVTKSTYANDPTKVADAQLKANFEGGDTVYVRLQIEEETQQRNEFIIKDELPNSAAKDIDFTFSREKDGYKASGKVTWVTEGGIKYLKFSPSGANGANKIDVLLNGKNYIDYAYKIL